MTTVGITIAQILYPYGNLVHAAFVIAVRDGIAAWKDFCFVILS